MTTYVLYWHNWQGIFLYCNKDGIWKLPRVECELSSEFVPKMRAAWGPNMPLGNVVLLPEVWVQNSRVMSISELPAAISGTGHGWFIADQIAKLNTDSLTQGIIAGFARDPAAQAIADHIDQQIVEAFAWFAVAEQARAAGYMVDQTCFPWVAYRGPRFAPTHFFCIPSKRTGDSEDIDPVIIEKLQALQKQKPPTSS
jgi:hypothetical protein